LKLEDILISLPYDLKLQGNPENGNDGKTVKRKGGGQEKEQNRKAEKTRVRRNQDTRRSKPLPARSVIYPRKVHNVGSQEEVAGESTRGCQAGSQKGSDF